MIDRHTISTVEIAWRPITAAVRWPAIREMLSSTEEGLLYDAELELFDYVFQQFQPEDLRFQPSSGRSQLLQPAQLNSALTDSIIGANNQLLAGARKSADQIITATFDAIQRSEDRGWSIGITIGTGGFGPYGMLDFSINGIGAGIGFSMPDIAITNIVPDWHGIRVPINLNARTSGSSAPVLARNLVVSQPLPRNGSIVYTVQYDAMHRRVQLHAQINHRRNSRAVGGNVRRSQSGRDTNNQCSVSSRNTRF